MTKEWEAFENKVKEEVGLQWDGHVTGDMLYGGKISPQAVALYWRFFSSLKDTTPELKVFTLNEKDIIEKIRWDLEHEMDAETVAQLAGKYFGGTCVWDGNNDKYVFIPNEAYWGWFDDYETENISLS
jgi:hypothetical protein